MALVAIAVFAAGAFRDSNEEVFAFGFAHIEEISAAFARPYAFGEHALLVIPVAVPVAAAKIAPIPVTATAAVAAAVPIVAPVAEIPVSVSVSVAEITPVSPLKMPVFHLSYVLLEKFGEKLRAKVDFPVKHPLFFYKIV